MVYRIIYCCDRYTLADALRPNPFWGKIRYSVDVEESTDDEVIEAAKQSAPPGYSLQRLEAIGGDPHVRTVYAKAVPTSIREPQP